MTLTNRRNKDEDVNREGDEKILFYYEGSEKDFKKLDDASKLEITSNASKIIFNTSYTPYYGR